MVKALVVASNKEKALVGDFSRQCETLQRFVDSSDLNPIHVTCPPRSGSVEVTYGAEEQGIELIWSMIVIVVCQTSPAPGPL